MCSLAKLITLLSFGAVTGAPEGPADVLGLVLSLGGLPLGRLRGRPLGFFLLGMVWIIVSM